MAWLLPLYAVATILSVLTVYFIVTDAATESLDQGLDDAATIYAERLRAEPGLIGQPELPSQAQRVLLATPDDRLFFSLRDADGTLLAGSAGLAEDEPWGSLAEPARFNLQHRGYWLRGISTVFEAGGRALHLTLATTSHKRDLLMGEITLGMVAPQVLLFIITLVLVWAGILQGLAPLASLRAELALRSDRDLRPLDIDSAPGELRPIVEDVNKLMLRLDQAIASQRHFIADAAHQLRTPIAGLLAQMEANHPHDAQPALLASARRLSHLVAQLLTLSRAEPGVGFAGNRFDWAAEIRAAAADWLPAAFERDIDVRFELEETCLYGSPGACREMVANLVDNAIRYGRRGGRIEVRCFADAGEAVLQVDDDGAGIPEEMRSRVFERFLRLPGTTTEGCGLGLAIVAGFARQHGGRVVLLSAPALGGLRAEVRLPVGIGCKPDVSEA